MIRKQLIFPLIREICEEEGIPFLEEPSRGVYGVLMFPGKRNYFIKDVNLNLNPSAAAALARNKAATSYFLQRFGYKVPEYTMVYPEDFCRSHHLDDTLDKAVAFAGSIGYPVMAKLNDSSKGRGIYKVHDDGELRQAAAEIFRSEERFQVQKFYDSRDYRVVVLGQKILSAYQRIPLQITGDGRSTVRQLLEERQRKFIQDGRDTILELDDDLMKHLARHQLALECVPSSGRRLVLRDVSNLSAGGECLDLTEEIHPGFCELCRNIARELSLNLCGIDILCPDLRQAPEDYVILEVNSSPGLDNYAFTGERQASYVKELYRSLILFLRQRLLASTEPFY